MRHVAICIYPQGAGSAMVVVATYSWCLRSTLAATDLPETVSTFSLVSGLWTAAFALGNFAGPSLAGVIYEQVCRYRMLSSFIYCYLLLSRVVSAIYYLVLSSAMSCAI